MEIKKNKQWSNHSMNFISGCTNNCIYCYAKAMAISSQRKTADNWATEEIREKGLNKVIKKKDGVIMFPSSHDITLNNLENSIEFLKKILEAENDVLIVSKPNPKCIEEICKAVIGYKEKITFRFTIGSSSDEVLSFWEPNAPSFEERLKALKHGYSLGFTTSVSCEPMLDSNISDVIEKVRPFVNESIWIGKMNNIYKYLTISQVEDESVWDKVKQITYDQRDENILNIYEKYKDDKLIKWKHSVMEIIEKKVQKS